MGNAGKKLSDVITSRVADEWNKSAARNDGIENRAGSIIRPGRSLKEVTGFFYHFLTEPYDNLEDDPREHYPAIRRGDLVYLRSPIRDPHDDDGQFPSEWIINSSLTFNIGGTYNETTTIKPPVGSRTNPTPAGVSGNSGDNASPIRIGVAIDTIPHGSTGRVQVGGLAAVRIDIGIYPYAAYWESNGIPRALPDVIYDGLKARIERPHSPTTPPVVRWIKTFGAHSAQGLGLYVKPRAITASNIYFPEDRGIEQSSYSTAGAGVLWTPRNYEWPHDRAGQHYPRLVWLQKIDNEKWLDLEYEDHYGNQDFWDALLWAIVDLDGTPSQGDTRNSALGHSGYVTSTDHHVGADHIENGPHHETPWPLASYTSRNGDGPWFLDDAATVENLDRLAREDRYHLRNQASHGNRNDYFAAKEKGAASGSDYRMDIMGFTPCVNSSDTTGIRTTPGETEGIVADLPAMGWRYNNEHNLLWVHNNRNASATQGYTAPNNALGSVMFCQCSINFEPFGEFKGEPDSQNKFTTRGSGVGIGSHHYVYPALETPEGEQATNYNKEFVADSTTRNFWDKMAFVGDYTKGNWFNAVEPNFGSETWDEAHINAGEVATEIGFYAPRGAQNIPLCTVMDLKAGIIVPDGEWYNKDFETKREAAGFPHEDFRHPIGTDGFLGRYAYGSPNLEYRGLPTSWGNPWMKTFDKVGVEEGTAIVGNSFTSESGGATLRLEGPDDSNFQRVFFDAPDDGSLGDFVFVLPIRTTLIEYVFTIVENYDPPGVAYHYVIPKYIDDDYSLGQEHTFRTFDSEIKITARVVKIGYDVELVLQQSRTVYGVGSVWYDTNIRTRRYEDGAGPWSIQAAGFHRLENSFDGEFSHNWYGSDLRWAVRTRATIVGDTDFLSLNGFRDAPESGSYYHAHFYGLGGDANLVGIMFHPAYPLAGKNERFRNAGGFQSFRGVGWGITNFAKTINNGD